MKIKDLLQDAIQSSDDQGDNVTAECFEELQEILEDGELGLLKKEGEGQSHSLGGSMRANVSGAVKLVKNYTSHGPYNSTTHWDYCLQVGNAIDGDALKEVRKLFAECKSTAKEFEPNRVEEHGGSIFHAYFGDGSVSVIYEYARSFCWLAIRMNKNRVKEDLTEGAATAAVKLAKSAAKGGHKALTKAQVEKSFGNVYDEYKKAYDAEKQAIEDREAHEAWREKRADALTGRKYHE